ncbi:hypothetical protein [Streptomyces sp. NPDC001500]
MAEFIGCGFGRRLTGIALDLFGFSWREGVSNLVKAVRLRRDRRARGRFLQRRAFFCCVRVRPAAPIPVRIALRKGAFTGLP